MCKKPNVKRIASKIKLLYFAKWECFEWQSQDGAAVSKNIKNFFFPFFSWLLIRHRYVFQFEVVRCLNNDLYIFRKRLISPVLTIQAVTRVYRGYSADGISTHRNRQIGSPWAIKELWLTQLVMSDRYAWSYYIFGGSSQIKLVRTICP